MKRFAFLITITFVCCFYSCNSSTKESETKKTIVDEKYLELPKLLREVYCNIFEENDPRDLAIIDQIEDYYRMMADNSTSIDMYCKSLSRLVDTLKNEIDHFYSTSGFSLLMRVTALNVFYNKNMFNVEKGKTPLDCNCYNDGMYLPYRWTSLSDGNLEVEIMSTTWCENSEPLLRYAKLSVVFRETKETQASVLEIVNHIDKTIDSLQFYLIDSNNSIIELYNINTDEYKVGKTIRIIIPTENILYALNHSELMVIEYIGKDGRVELISFAPRLFREQIKDFPRLNKMMNVLVKK